MNNEEKSKIEFNITTVINYARQRSLYEMEKFAEDPEADAADWSPTRPIPIMKADEKNTLKYLIDKLPQENQPWAFKFACHTASEIHGQLGDYVKEALKQYQ